MTFTDNNRSTPAWGPTAKLPYRKLVTTIFYPAKGSLTDGSASSSPAPSRPEAPYPLIVFAHGLGGSPAGHTDLLKHWAAAGYVVAAPAFPLTSRNVPGGPNAGDVLNQPADMSFLISSMIRASRGSGPLSGLVDPEKVAAAGHSNGAVTTEGLAAESCCRDPRLKAAIIMAGSAGAFAGKAEWDQAPPIMVVHGTADSLMPYSGGVSLFNSAKGPKALLSLSGGDHQAAAGDSPTSVR